MNEIFAELQHHIKPGLVRKEIDLLAAKLMKKHNVMSALSLQGFPGAISISLNKEITQGLPDYTLFKEGDLVSLDLTIAHRGLFVDKARSFTLDPSHFSNRYICNAAEKCFNEALGFIHSRISLGQYPSVGDIGAIIEGHARYLRVMPIKEFYGHGVGELPHMEPLIPNVSEPLNTTKLYRDMAITIEPIVFYGESYYISNQNEYTVVADVISAHWEDTIWVGDSGVEVLT